jgi:anti-sigma B factor antagonist
MAYRRCKKCWEKHSLSETVCLNCGADLSTAEVFKDVADVARDNRKRFFVAERAIGDVMILDLAGLFAEGCGTDELGQRVAILLDRGCRKFLVNLADVIGGDGSAIEELVRAFTAAARRGGAIKIVRSGRVGQFNLIDMTKLVIVFETFDDDAEALRSYE